MPDSVRPLIMPPLPVAVAAGFCVAVCRRRWATRNPSSIAKPRHGLRCDPLNPSNALGLGDAGRADCRNSLEGDGERARVADLFRRPIYRDGEVFLYRGINVI